MNPARNQRYFKIGEAAKLLGLSSETLRRWEKAGRVTFSRTPGGKRLFSEADLDSLRHLLEPTHEPPQTSTSIFQAQKPNKSRSEKITVSINIPKFSFPKFNFNFTKISIALVILILLVGNIFFFSKTPYSQQAVLGAETFIAPAIEEGGPVSSFFIEAGKTFSALGSLFRNNPIAGFIIPLVQNVEQKSTSGNLEVNGKAVVSKDIEGLGNLKIKGTATVGKLVTGIVDPYLIENDGTVKSTLEIKSTGDIALEPGTSGSGNVTLGGNNISGVNTLTTTNLNSTNLTTNTLTIQGNIQTPKITTTSDVTIGGNITLTGVINSNTLTSTSLVFSGSSPSIYPSTTNTGISLNANGTGAINIGNSSTGDIYLGGGSSSGTRCLVTNSSGSFGCTGTLSGPSLSLTAASGGTTNAVNISSATGFTNFFKTPTFNLDSSGNITGVAGLTATTLTGTISTASQTNITAVGTLSSLSVTGNINSTSGSLQTNTVTRIDNSGNLTAGTGSFGGTVTPSLDATYDFGSAVKRWNNAYFAGDVTAGDVVFKNKFRMTENGNGIDFYSPKGEKVASIDENGNFWVKGEIKHGTGN